MRTTSANWNEGSIATLDDLVDQLVRDPSGSGRSERLLPGTPTIPEQIAADKQPYYNALEAADREWTNEKVDVSKLEAVIEAMLSQQLIHAVKQASGEATG